MELQDTTVSKPVEKESHPFLVGFSVASLTFGAVILFFVYACAQDSSVERQALWTWGLFGTGLIVGTLVAGRISKGWTQVNSLSGPRKAIVWIAAITGAVLLSVILTLHYLQKNFYGKQDDRA